MDNLFDIVCIYCASTLKNLRESYAPEYRGYDFVKGDLYFHFFYVWIL